MITKANEQPNRMKDKKHKIRIKDDQKNLVPDFGDAKQVLRPQFGDVFGQGALTPPS
jgi:hypothetical protein